MSQNRPWSGEFGPASKRFPVIHQNNNKKNHIANNQKQKVESRPSTTGDMKRITKRYDPINSIIVSDLAPALPPVYDSLNPYRRIHSSHKDAQSNENKHREALLRNSHTFHRKKGGAQSYIESATRQSDMLVWQNSQSRDEATTSLLNRLSTRPKSEVYNINSKDLANTARNATSPFLSYRHSTAHARRITQSIESQNIKSSLSSSLLFDRNDSTSNDSQYVNDNINHQNQNPSISFDNHTFDNHNHHHQNSKVSSRGGGSLYDRKVISSHSINTSLIKQEDTHNKLLEFERKQHQKMNFSDWTKFELIELIEAEGLEVPGEMLWDNEAGEMRKEICSKQVYVDHCKRKLFEAEPKPLVRSGKRLRMRESYCIVDIFKAAHGAVRVQAYDDQDSREYQMLLIPNKMHELDLDPPPTTSHKKQWHLWSKLLIPRLELTDDGLLQVGDPPLQENGLPAHFTLGASSSLSTKRGHHSSHHRSNASQQTQQQMPAQLVSGLSRQNSSRSLTSNSTVGTMSVYNQSSSHNYHGGSNRHGKVKELPPPDRMHVTLFFRSL
mmetsp:Transcript_13212/g.17125  ORF Transcript_13212/g.17125 Transcript_13212/m.17125 type:complete len:554 (-) Transcript_13212:146-1807(-)